MQILLVHNYYRHRGGEAVVFHQEAELLKGYGHKVYKLTIDSSWYSGLLLFKYFVNGKFRFIRELKTLLERVQLIHIHNFFPFIPVELFGIALKSYIPVVVTLHNFRLLCLAGVFFDGENICMNCVKSINVKSILQKRCYKHSYLFTLLGLGRIGQYRNVLEKVNRLIVLTEYHRRLFSESFCSHLVDKMVVKPNFCYPLSSTNAKREPAVAYIGRLSREKGIELLIKAMANLGCKLYIAGDGPMRDFVLKSVKAYNNICYLGYLNKAKVSELVNRVSALVVPSICYESMPMIILESFSAGVPVIAANLGPIADIVKDGETGLLFKMGDWRDLRQKIEQILNDPMAFRDSCYKQYYDNYSPEANYNMLIKIYKEEIEHAKR